MTGCPDLVALEARAQDVAVAAHVASCQACRLAVELIEMTTGEAAAGGACARFEPLLAARLEGGLGSVANALLEDHLAICDDCRAVAETVAPRSDVHGDLAELPAVAPGAYALGAEVARGGMGRILAARDLRIGRPVAVKELLGRSARLAARFEREARVTARLQHPGIVPIYEIGRWPDGTPFYSMRMVEGRTLKAALLEASSSSARLALVPALLAAAEAVAFAHAQRVIHRDLTPANILVGAYGETVVIDWGLAKDLAADDDDAVDAGPYRVVEAELTAAGAVLGTPAYMPPEQAAGAPVDARGDVYALGAILYHLLVGAPPYRGTSADEVLDQVKAAPPRAVRAAAPGAPPDLISIVDKAMARDPAARYATARDFAEELARFQAGRLVEAHVYSRAQLLRRWARRNRRPLAVAAFALVALLVGGTIAVANVVRSRDRADAARAVAEEQRVSAETSAAFLLEEQGRQELLAGNSFRAAAWLSASYSAGNERPSLRFLLARAMRDVESVERTLECGADVKNVTFSPDGAEVTVACGPEERRWRTDTWIELPALAIPGHASGYTRYSQAGTVIATWGDAPDGDVWLWDRATGDRIRTLDHAAEISNVAFFDEDRRLLTTTWDGVVRVWEVSSGAQLLQIDASVPTKRGVWGGLVSNGRFVTASGDGTLSLWSLASGKRVSSVKNPSQIFGHELVEPEPGRVLVCSPDGFVRIWDLEAGRLVASFAAHAGIVFHCELDPEKRRVLTSGRDGAARLWDLGTGRLVRAFDAGGLCQQASFVLGGRIVITSSMQTGVRLFDAATGTLLASDDIHHPDVVTISPQGDQAVLGVAHQAIVLPIPERGVRRAFVPPAGLHFVNADAHGAHVVVEDEQGIVSIWDTATNEPLTMPRLHDARTGDCCDRIAARTEDDAVVVVDVRTAKVVATFRPDAPIDGYELSNDGLRLRTLSRDWQVVWDVATGAVIGRYQSNGILGGMSDDGRYFLTFGRAPSPASCTIHAADTGAVVSELEDPPAPGSLIGFSDDGTRVVFRLGEDGAYPVGARIWDVATGKVVTTIDRAFVWGGLDPAGSLLAVAGVGPTEVWRLDGTRVLSLPPPSLEWGLSVNVSADREFVALGEALSAQLQLWSSDGRLLRSVALPEPEGTIGDRSFQLGLFPVGFSQDGTVLLGVTEGLSTIDLHLETRAPEEIARTVVDRVPFRVEDGRLVAR